ncbi:unnamed protein product [Cochlearia groenlandica]
MSSQTVKEDRISALPDDLLVTILLIIPTEETPATMVLSKRWRFIWTKLHRLIYKDDKIMNVRSNKKKSLGRFLEKSLELNKAPVIDYLSMELGRGCPTDIDLKKLVAKAVDRKVSVLIFNLQWLTNPTRLPNRLYTCETLWKLSLSHRVFVDIPDSNYYACLLPSLLWLVLDDVLYKNDSTVSSFLSACPQLCVLTVKRIKGDNVKKFVVKVPSLSVLGYEKSNVINLETCLVIDTPALKSFFIIDRSQDSISVENMPLLEDASVNIMSFPNNINHKFFTSIYKALSLDLFLHDDLIISSSSAIDLSRTVTCEMFLCSDNALVVSFLQKYTTQLKYLTIEYYIVEEDEDNQLPHDIVSSTMNNYSSECLSSLEEFKVLFYEGRREEKMLMEYVLRNSSCLKTITISLQCYTLEHEETMKEELEAIPRLSITSMFLFTSLYIY